MQKSANTLIVILFKYYLDYKYIVGNNSERARDNYCLITFFKTDNVVRIL
jgi:hypothetical protein